MFIEIYNTILYEPLFNLLVFFYNIVPGNDIGLAIILLTIFIKLILSPFFIQSIKAQRAMQTLQPKLDELKEKFKDEKDKLGPAIMELYKKEKVSPFSSCLPLLIQLPFLIAVYQVFRTGLANGSLDKVYSFITNPGAIDPISFGIVDLGQASIFMAVLAGGAQFLQSKIMLGKTKKMQTNTKAKSPMASAMGKQMMYFMPIITIVIGANFPAGLTFYWLLTTLFSVAQQYFVLGKKKTTVEVVEK